MLVFLVLITGDLVRGPVDFLVVGVATEAPLNVLLGVVLGVTLLVKGVSTFPADVLFSFPACFGVLGLLETLKQQQKFYKATIDAATIIVAKPC